MLCIVIFTIIFCVSFCLGNLVGNVEIFAATQQTSLSNFKNVGDYYYASVDTNGKTSLGATLPTTSHVAAISGIYTLEIYTPKGVDGNSGGNNDQTIGSAGQYLSVNIKIARGSKITTVGNLAEGIGIRGVVQLAGGNGGNGSGTYDGVAGNGGSAYFGGRGGNGGTGHYSYSLGMAKGGKGGDGYVGGTGGNNSYAKPGVNNGGTGGDGYVPGQGGKDFYGEVTGATGTTYSKPAGANMINQDASGSVKYYVGGNMPAFTTSANNGTVGSIKLTLKTIDNSIGLNEGIVSVQLTESDSYESLQQIATNTARIADALENSEGTSGDTDVITNSTVFSVVKGKYFDIYIPIESNKQGNTTIDNIVVINNDTKDGLLQITGTSYNAGNKEVVVGDTKFVICTIEEPDSTNVNATLH